MGSNNDIIIDRGATFKQTLQWIDPSNNPINLAGYTAKLQVRIAKGDTTTPLLDLTTENGGITLTAETGWIAIVGSESFTQAMPAGTFWYDLLMKNGAEYTRLVEGRAIVTEEVTIP